MATENYFNGYLCITKEEEIVSLPFGKELKALVLESRIYPGYYSCFDSPEENKPLTEKFLYLVIKGHTHCFQDKIIRKLQKIKATLNAEFNACPGEIKVFNKMSSCIRITNVDIELLNQIVSLLKKEDIVFHQHKNIKPYQGFIHIKKWVELTQLDNGIFQNIENKNEYFIEVQQQLDWNDFVKVTTEVKNNCRTMLFDAAQGAILQKCAMKDYVRIYSANCDVNRLPELREYYNKEINRHFS